jgi:hypothetical protein
VAPWTKWPLFGRIAFLVFALAAVAAGFVELSAVGPGLLAAASRRVAPVGAGVASFWNVISALTGAVALAAEHLGKGFMLACLVAVAAAWAVCAGFGTILVRLALAKPGKSLL